MEIMFQEVGNILSARNEITYATLLFIETLIGYLDLENQDVQSKICRGCFVTSPKVKISGCLKTKLNSTIGAKFSTIRSFCI